MTLLVVGILVAAAPWLAWAQWGWPRGAAGAGQRNDNAIFVGTALLAMYAAGVGLWWNQGHGRMGQTDEAGADVREELTEPSVFELRIGADGRFVGGDEEATTLVVELLDLPTTSRSIRVTAVPLEDRSFRLEEPHEYVQLRGNVRAYEVSLGRLLRGTVHYYLPWRVEDLVEAILELRRIELPAQYDRQRHYCWDPEDLDIVPRVELTAEDVRSVQTGYYGLTSSRQPHTAMGLPSDEPIWIVNLFPSIIWQRVVPAVVADRRQRHPDPPDPPALDITRWVISDRGPSDLARHRPSREPGLDDRVAWHW